MQPQYKRILLKLSGESLTGPDGFGISLDKANQIAQEIKATADKERTIILAEANKQSEIIRGQGDAYVTEKAAKIYGKDPQFYDFYRSLNAYKAALKDDTTTFILSPKESFFKYMHR